jgi:hypothetical protein
MVSPNPPQGCPFLTVGLRCEELVRFSYFARDLPVVVHVFEEALERNVSLSSLFEH